MERAWAALGLLIERLTLKRIAVALPLFTLFAGCLLSLSVLMEEPLSAPFALPVQAEAPWPAELPTAEPTSSPTPEPTGTPVPELASTATPTQVGEPPAPPTAEPAPTRAATPTSTPLPLGPDDLNIVLLGTDRRPLRDSSWRTDSIIVVAIRPQAGRVAMLSIPRDLWVTIPGYGAQRINVADCQGERMYGPGGGPRLVGETLRHNLGIPVHAYVRVDFAGLERIIDTLGGISLTVDRAYDEWMDEGMPELWHLQLEPGWQHLDGRTVLGYARSRRYSNDFDRSRRQQQILLAVRDAALQPAVVPELPELVSALYNAVDTDLSTGQILSLIRLACQIDRASYHSRVFDNTMARDWVTRDGAMVLLPNRARIERVWQELTTG